MVGFGPWKQPQGMPKGSDRGRAATIQIPKLELTGRQLVTTL
jgi:hypothetical protein